MTEQENQNANNEAVAAMLPKPPPDPVLTYRMVGDMAALFAAKAKARLGFKPITKNREVEVQPKKRDDGSWPAKYKFTYATLDSVRDSCDQALAENGLDIFHVPCTGLDGRELHTFLAHSSGAFIQAVLLIPDVKNWQEFGSAMTYAERYSYVALAGVASEHDDDGNAADGNQVQNSQPRDRSKPPEPPKTRGKGSNGSAAQPSTPPKEAPKPAQDEPAQSVTPASDPKPDQAKAPPPAAAATPSGLLPEQLKSLGGLFRGQGWARPMIDQLLLETFAKDHSAMSQADGAQLIQILELGAAGGYGPQALLDALPGYTNAEHPNPQAVIDALQPDGAQ